MAIRNTKLGGTDWSSGNYIVAGDLNDTIDEIARLVDNGN